MVRPKKNLGQHFLTDQNIAARIVNSLNLSAVKNVLEVGPGKGVLTRLLMELPDIQLKLVEIDPESVNYLKIELGQKCPEIFASDFLKMDFHQVFDNQPFVIIGNFPYNISTQIIFKVLESGTEVSQLVGMFQKEVAERICHQPGNKEYGILSVLTQAFFNTTYLFSVREGVFFPPPAVKSGVIRLERKNTALPEVTYAELARIVKMGFNQRRKQLRNSIRALLPEGFDIPVLTKRPEQLDWKEFQDIILLIKA